MQKSFTNQKPKVSVNILGYNCEKYIKNCIKAVTSQTYPNIEILYIDNASKDKSFEIVSSLKNTPNLKIIKNNKNIGYAAGNNLGIDKTSGDYILILNPDILLDNNFVHRVVSLLETNRNIGAATGKILKFNFQYNSIDKTNILDSLGLEIYKNHRVVELGGEEINSKQYENPIEIFGVSGAAPIIRRKALKDIKFNGEYFDESFFAYKEDVDLSFRLKHAGWQCWLEPKAKAWHDRWERGSGKSSKTSSIIKKRKKKSSLVNYLSYRNHLIFILKNEWAINLFLYFPWIFAYEFKKLLYTLFFEPKNLKAWVYFFKNLPLTLKKRYANLSKSKLKPSKVRSWLI